MLPFILVISLIADSKPLVKYNLYKNYGKTFYDYSENYRHAINGNSASEDGQDTTPTDRGAYFTPGTTSGLIKIPETDAVNGKIEFSAPFAMHVWMNLIDIDRESNSAIFLERIGSSSGLGFTVHYSLKSGLKISDSADVEVPEESSSPTEDSFSTPESSSPSRSLFESGYNRHLSSSIFFKEWFLLSVKVTQNLISISKNSETLVSITIPNYSESSELFSTNIGGKPKAQMSIVGFIWNFIIEDDISINYYSNKRLLFNCDESQASLNEKCFENINLDPKYDSQGNICKGCIGCNEKICLLCECENSSCEYSQAKKSSLCKCPKGINSNETYCQCSLGQFFNGKKCENCKIENCYLCSSENICKVCQEQYQVRNGICECKSGTFQKGKKCEKCQENCDRCENENKCDACLAGFFKDKSNCSPCGRLCEECTEIKCKKCFSHAGFVKESLLDCECEKGYFGDKTCERRTFSAEVSVNGKNQVIVSFSEKVEPPLKVSNFNYKVTGLIQYEVEFEAISSDKYMFSINSPSDIPESCTFEVWVKEKSIYSENNSLYISTSLSVKLKKTETIDSRISNLRNIAKPLTTAVIIASAVTGMLGHPGLFWILFNTLELISYAPIGAVPYPSSLVEFFTRLNALSIFPSPSSIVGLDGKSCPPYLEARRYGNDSCLFFVNVDVIVAQLILNVVVIFLFKGLKLWFFSRFFEKVLKKYRFGYFLTLVVAASLDVSLFALVQIRSVAVILAPVVILIASYKCLTRIYNPNDHEFQSKWGNLFREFKKDRGFFSTQFYFVFITRRILFSFTQVFLNSIPLLQLILNFSGTLVVLGYLGFYRPYIDRSLMISEFIGEGAVLITFGFSFGFLTDLNQDTSDALELTIMIVNVSTMILQVLVSFADLIYSFLQKKKHNTVSKIQNIRQDINIEKIAVSTDVIDSNFLGNHSKTRPEEK